MLAYEEALQKVLGATSTIGSQTIPLSRALGRVLAAPVISRITQPPFDGSAMDGYAVIADDVKPGARLEKIGESQAGKGFEGRVKNGQCVRIFTGAPMPEGADSVIIQELASADGRLIRFEKPVRTGQNVRPRGQDFMAGEKLLEEGTQLNPAAISLIAAANVAEIQVHEQPMIALLATGDELVEPGEELKSGQIVASNGFSLAALLSPLARKITDMGNAGDNEAELREKFRQALDGPHDIIISTGGASVGDHDLVLPTLKALGVEIDFWKIAIRPGKPVIFGKKDKKLIFALPGNPVSAYISAVTVVIPAVRAICGQKNPTPQSLFLPLGAPLPANGPRRHFMRGKIIELNGASHAVPILQTDSSHLSSLSEADILLVALENCGPLEIGTIVQTIPLPLNLYCP